MTLTQLETFVLVARLGSVKAAARSLGVSEPAVSAALAALRQQLGDTLVERTARGMELTPGGRRLVPIASQMVGLAVEAEAAIRQAQGAPETLRVVATSEVAESVAPALVAAFATRANAVEVSLGVSMTDDMAALLQERLADVAIGPRLTSDGFPRLECSPLFRFRLIFVAAPSHRLAQGASGAPGSAAAASGAPGSSASGSGASASAAAGSSASGSGASASVSPLAPRVLARETWLVGPDAGDQRSPVRALIDRLRVPEDRIRMFPSHAAALTAAEQQQGIAPAVAHVVLDDPDRKGLVQLPVRGTPLDLLWHVTMLASDRRSTAAAAFHRFVSTPAATHAMHTPIRGVPPSRFKPPVYVTLWA